MRGLLSFGPEPLIRIMLRSAFSGCDLSLGNREVPAFIIGVLATLAAALVALCRGPARADSPVTGHIVRWWAAVWLPASGHA